MAHIADRDRSKIERIKIKGIIIVLLKRHYSALYEALFRRSLMARPRLVFGIFSAIVKGVFSNQLLPLTLFFHMYGLVNL